MHERKAIIGFPYEKAIMSNISTKGQGLKLLESVTSEGIHIKRSKTKKRKLQDTSSDFRWKPRLQGLQDLLLLQHMPSLLKIVSPEQKTDKEGNMADIDTNIKSNGEVVEALEACVTWRNAVYDPCLGGKFPPAHLLRAKHTKVDSAIRGMYQKFLVAFDNRAIPYMHHALPHRLL